MLLNLRVNNNTLVAYHSSLTESKPTARLIADRNAAITNVSVDNVYGFAVGQYLLIGNWGDRNAEIIRVHASTAPSGQTITLASGLVFDHYTDTSVTVLDYNQIEFSRATTPTGSKSVLATVDIMPDQLYTTYIDTTNTTGYAFFRFKNAAGSTFSNYCSDTSYSGNGDTSFEKIALEACAKAAVNYGTGFALESQLIDDANEAIDRIQEKQDWVFELVKNDSSITTTTNENEYALSGLTYEPKYRGTAQGILNVYLGTGELNQLSSDEMDKLLEGVAKTTLASQISASDTSVTLTDSNDFSESGTIYVSTISAASYTANAQSTGILSGFSSSTFTGTIAAGTNVFQGVAPSLPTKYAIFNYSIFLDVPVSSTYAGRKIKVKYLRKLSRITSFASTTEIPFPTVITFYIAAKIAARKQQYDDEQKFMNQFNDIVTSNMDLYKLPVLDEYDYYTFTAKPQSSNW